jgi:6-phospho-beta-glucosidase
VYHKNLKEFSDSFLWGASSAAYQVEGACDEDGRGPSVWDIFLKETDYSYMSATGDVASDHYHRYKEDVKLMKELGLKAYRFSVSWSRILPDGTGNINPKGLQFYHHLIDELLANGIEPVLTIYHFDIPWALEKKYRGWLSREIINDFDNYCRILYKEFGHKVKWWLTINEQNLLKIKFQEISGANEKEVFAGNHIVNLANAKAIQSFRELVPSGKIGPAIASLHAYPASADPRDNLAAMNYNAFQDYLWMDVYCKGRYTPSVWNYLAENELAPAIESGDSDLLRSVKPDYIGVNYYMSFAARYCPENEGKIPWTTNKTGAKGAGLKNKLPGVFEQVQNPFLEATEWDWTIDPIGLRIVLRDYYERYGLPMLITENGLGARDVLEAGDIINDHYRIDYLRNHIEQMKLAVTDGVPVIGYCLWSFTDVFSWSNGYQKRYGLVYINRDEHNLKDLRRIKKQSYYWYKDVIATNGRQL